MIITNAHLAYNIYSYGIRNGGKIYTSRRAIILYDNIYYVISSQWAYALTYWSAYNRQSDTMVANKIESPVVPMVIQLILNWQCGAVGI